MELIPAIDILDGKVVRLRRGRYDEVTIFADDPAEPARRFHEAGAARLHVVDLDGARDGRPGNVRAIERILAAVPIEVQVGGGIRDAASAERWLAAGAQRVVLGTAAVRSPELVRALAEKHSSAVVVAVDARAGKVMIEGWTEGSGRDALDVAREADARGVIAVLYTNIERDGTREGPDVEGTIALQREVGATVIASGGIGTLDHLRALASAGVRATVCGRALYDGAFTIEDAFAAAEGR